MFLVNLIKEKLFGNVHCRGLPLGGSFVLCGQRETHFFPEFRDFSFVKKTSMWYETTALAFILVAGMQL